MNCRNEKQTLKCSIIYRFEAIFCTKLWEITTMRGEKITLRQVIFNPREERRRVTGVILHSLIFLLLNDYHRVYQYFKPSKFSFQSQFCFSKWDPNKANLAPLQLHRANGHRKPKGKTKWALSGALPSLC